MKKVCVWFACLVCFMFVGCTATPPKAENFTLAVTIAAENITLGTPFEIKAEFKNLSNKKYNIRHSGGKDISTMILIRCDNESKPQENLPLNSINGVMEKQAILSKTYSCTVDTTGNYKIYAIASFSIGDVIYTIKSNVIEKQWNT